MGRTYLIFLNGDCDIDLPEGLPGGERCLVAVDGGGRHLFERSILPDVLIGDLDSVPRECLEWCRANRVPVIKYPAEKDQTDAELALDYARDNGADKVLVYGALGGRIDHTLANIALLSGERYAGLEPEITGRRERMIFIRRHRQIHANAGDLVSLLPLGSSCEGVSTLGLQYPLAGEVLYPESTRGISNVMLSDTAEITCEKGVLLCVITCGSC